MGSFLKAAVGIGVVAAGVLATASPAAAHGDAGLAFGAGMLGAGVGAVIASGHMRPYPAGYAGYYAPPPPPPVYYAPPVAYAPPPPAYGYRAPAYGYGYGYGYAPRCRIVERWNPYWGGYQRSRQCW